MKFLVELRLHLLTFLACCERLFGMPLRRFTVVELVERADAALGGTRRDHVGDGVSAWRGRRCSCFCAIVGMRMSAAGAACLVRLVAATDTPEGRMRHSSVV